MKKGAIFILVILLSSSLVLADLIFPFFRPKPNNTTIEVNTSFGYNITFAQNSDCSGISLSRNLTAVTDQYGIANLLINISTLNGYPRYICEYRNSSLRKTHNISSAIFDRLVVSRNVNVSDDVSATNFIASRLVSTANVSGNQSWSDLYNYPTGCGESQIPGLGDTLTCTTISRLTNNASINGTLIIKPINQSQNVTISHNGTNAVFDTINNYFFRGLNSYEFILTNGAGGGEVRPLIIRNNSVEANLSWANLSTYPAACGDDQYLSALDDSPTCTAINNVDLSGYINSTSTILAANLSGNLTWSALYSYPSSCGDDQYVSALGDSATCTAINNVDLSGYINSTSSILAVNLSGNLSWSSLYNYPGACPSGQFLTQLGDTVTCAPVTVIFNNLTLNATLIIKAVNLSQNLSLSHNGTTAIFDSLNSFMFVASSNASAFEFVIGDRPSFPVGYFRIENGSINTTGNFSLGDRIFFRNGQFIRSLNDGEIQVSGNFNVTSNLSIQDRIMFRNAQMIRGIEDGSLALSSGVNLSGNLNVTNEISLRERIGFRNGQAFRSINDGEIATSGNFNVTGNLTIGERLTFRNSQFIQSVESDIISFSGGFAISGPLIVNNFTVNKSINLLGNYTTNISMDHNTTALIIGSTSNPQPSIVFEVSKAAFILQEGADSAFEVVFVNGTPINDLNSQRRVFFVTNESVNATYNLSVSKRIQFDTGGKIQGFDAGTTSDTTIGVIGQLNVSNNVTVRDRLSFGNSQYIHSPVAGDIGVSSNFNVTGNLTIGSRLTFGNSQFIQSVESDIISFSGGFAISGPLVVNNFTVNKSLNLLGNYTTNISIDHNTTAIIIGGTSVPFAGITFEVSKASYVLQKGAESSFEVVFINGTPINDLNSQKRVFFVTNESVNITTNATVGDQILFRNGQDIRELVGIGLRLSGQLNVTNNATIRNRLSFNDGTRYISSEDSNIIALSTGDSIRLMTNNTDVNFTVPIITDTVTIGSFKLLNLPGEDIGLTTDFSHVKLKLNSTTFMMGNSLTNISSYFNFTVNRFDGVFRFGGSNIITPGSYECGLDDEATAQLHCNVPTGATYEWSINDVAQLALTANQLQIRTGTEAAPQYSSIGDTNSGSGVIGSNIWSVSTDGDNRIVINTTNINLSIPILTSQNLTLLGHHASLFLTDASSTPNSSTYVVRSVNRTFEISAMIFDSNAPNSNTTLFPMLRITRGLVSDDDTSDYKGTNIAGNYTFLPTNFSIPGILYGDIVTGIYARSFSAIPNTTIMKFDLPFRPIQGNLLSDQDRFRQDFSLNGTVWLRASTGGGGQSIGGPFGGMQVFLGLSGAQEQRGELFTVAMPTAFNSNMTVGNILTVSSNGAAQMAGRVVIGSLASVGGTKSFDDPDGPILYVVGNVNITSLGTAAGHTGRVVCYLPEGKFGVCNNNALNGTGSCTCI